MGSVTTGTSPPVLGAMRSDHMASEQLVAGSPGPNITNHGSPCGESETNGSLFINNGVGGVAVKVSMPYVDGCTADHGVD